MDINTISFRLATEQDTANILRISEGIYSGEDYIPCYLHKWLNDPTRMIILVDHQENLIGLCIAAMTDDYKSFFCQGLRIVPKYRGKKLSYLVVNAVIDKVREQFDQVTKMLAMSYEFSPAYRLFTNLGANPIMKQTIHISQKINLKRVDQTVKEIYDSGYFSLEKKDAIQLYSNEKLLGLIGDHGVVLVPPEVPLHLPEEAQRLAKDIDQVFVDISAAKIAQGECPKSFSHGCQSHRDSKCMWMCDIFTDDPDDFKKHVVYQLNAAVDCWQDRELVIQVSQSSCAKFDSYKAINEVFSRLRLACEWQTYVAVLLDKDLIITKNDELESVSINE